MSEKDDDAEQREMIAGGAPISGNRIKHTPAEYLQLALPDFRRRADGLECEALQRDAGYRRRPARGRRAAVTRADAGRGAE